MARKYDADAILGEDFVLTPEVLAHEISLSFSTQIILQCYGAGISLSEFASLLGIDAHTLYERLNGENLTLENIAEMAIALGCDVEIVVEQFDDGNVETPPPDSEERLADDVKEYANMLATCAITGDVYEDDVYEDIMNFLERKKNLIDKYYDEDW